MQPINSPSVAEKKGGRGRGWKTIAFIKSRMRNDGEIENYLFTVGTIILEVVVAIIKKIIGDIFL